MRMVLAAAALVVVVGRAAAAGPHIETLYTAPGRIAAFAQDGTALAWFSPSTQTCNSIYVHDLVSGGTSILPMQTRGARNVTCRWPIGQMPVQLALAGSSALWTLREDSPLRFDYVLGAAVRDQAERRFQELAHGTHGAGLWLGGVAGDATRQGSALVYAVTNVDYTDELGCLAGSAPCTMRSAGGGVYRVVGRQPPERVPGTNGGAVDVAASGRTIAYVPTGSVAKDGQPLPLPVRPIEIRDVDGAAVSTVLPRGEVLAIALAPHVLATLERTHLGLRIAWYASATGNLRGSVPVARTIAPELAASDRVIVFRIGRSIRAVDEASRATRVLGRAAATPIGLSIEDTRIAWAENVHGHGRIRAIYVTG